MSDVIDINENVPHKVFKVLCLICFNQWIGVVPEGTDHTTLECPACGAQKSFTVHTHD